MQPASSTGADRSRQLRRWGPIAVIAVLVAVGGIVLATRDSGGDSSATSTAVSPANTTTVVPETSVASTGATTPGSETTTASTAAPAPLTYPMSFAQATAQGLADTIDWGSR
ncbi:MAG TPA: hypothetical protein VNB52_04270, partial [Ilumatobacteraceae bacterium]|nr:hypothetical protein [Ilumatobacteraceae bacterium]